MKRNTIRLTENQLHQVINESVKRVINEMDAWDMAGIDRRQIAKFKQEADEEKKAFKYSENPEQLLQLIQSSLEDDNGMKLYGYCQRLLRWVKENYNVEPTDWNHGHADGRRKGLS